MKRIEGQVIYVGPMIPDLGLQHGTIFRNGLHASHHAAIAQCPALGELFVSIADYGMVRRQLNFDIARNMRGTSGKFVTFYTETKNWLASRSAARQTSQPTIGAKL